MTIENGWARDLVGVCISTVQVVDDARVAVRVGAWEGNTSWESLYMISQGQSSRSWKTAYGSTRSANFDLNTSHVQLNTTVWVGSVGGIRFVKGKDLVTEEIFAIGEVGWKGDGVFALGGDELVHSPLASRVTILGNFDPNISNTVRCCWGKVCDQRTLVRLRQC